MGECHHYLGCDIGGAKELGVIYFPTNWGAKEPHNPPNHRVAAMTMTMYFDIRFGSWFPKDEFGSPPTVTSKLEQKTTNALRICWVPFNRAPVQVTWRSDLCQSGIIRLSILEGL